MGKRKAAAYEDDWLPTVPTSSYPAYNYDPAPGSSSNPILLDSPPAKAPAKAPARKRQKKAKDPDAPEPEKRLAKMKPRCPQNIMDRLERVQTQRFFMVDRKRNGDELREEFQVLGSTGNVYTVAIDKLPSCNCPDALKGNHCKHILFIYAKVLQVPFTSHVWYQKALLTSELQEIFANAPLAPNDMANPRVRDAYAQATGKAVASSSSSNSNRKLPKEDDDCPVCYEEMYGTAESKLSFCETCGNCLHKQCLTQWLLHKPTCPMCRSNWAGPEGGRSGRGKASVDADGYLNLASVAGLSPERDTSSYYHGPRRGERHYGYQYY
ncbi:hypothetical protein PsYK624_011560 [Phanerochaete sordida]|uniref:RING-type domain-containing protein n=1 Tax=Phanerochaete sordida TaxID=48140 RepID=A0A9P3FZC5_9APHY|nr:hypothetical protein PsYK624_011560 [Phanerochaete sordida]